MHGHLLAAIAQNNLLIFLNNQRQWPNRKLMRAIRFAAGELADMHWELEQSSLLGIPAYEPSANVALKPIENVPAIYCFHY